MIDSVALAEQVAVVKPQRLLAARGGTATSAVDRLALVDYWELGEGLAVLVLRDDRGSLHVAPSRVDSAGPRRAEAGAGLSQALVFRLAQGSAESGRFALRRLHGGPLTGERAMGVDQTNESVVVGSTAVVKWLNRVSADLHPAPGRLSLLDRAGFSSMPQPWGFLFWRDDAGRDVLLATVDAYLDGATDGWSWCVDDVRRFARGELTLAEAVAPAERVGALVASMHMAFASGGVTVAEPAACERWQQAAVTALEDVLDEVDGVERERLGIGADEIRTRLSRWSSVDAVVVMPVHGDLHVGQILRYVTGDGQISYAVTDFDGNPVLSPAERTSPQPAARDVAGYLQSLDHVGRVVVKRTEDVDEVAIHHWIGAAQQGFLSRYRHGLSEDDRGEIFQDELLDAMRVEQECREFLYAVRYDPVWRYVPDAAMGALLSASSNPPREES